MNALHFAAIMRHPVRGAVWIATCVVCDWSYETTNLYDGVEEMDQHTEKENADG